MLLTTGIALPIAALSVFFDDVQYLLTVLLMLLTLISPVYYPLSYAPEAIRSVLTLNPVCGDPDALPYSSSTRAKLPPLDLFAGHGGDVCHRSSWPAWPRSAGSVATSRRRYDERESPLLECRGVTKRFHAYEHRITSLQEFVTRRLTAQRRHEPGAPVPPCRTSTFVWSAMKPSR